MWISSNFLDLAVKQSPQGISYDIFDKQFGFCFLVLCSLFVFPSKFSVAC
jgi:multidrug transporter EmrE-like cation transporter